jgi:alpha-glucan,water dikinase
MVGYSSKAAALFAADGAPGLIFRSDSNAEDQEGNAGAGLFDSVPTPPPALRLVCSDGDPLLESTTFRKEVLSRIAVASLAVEAAMGGGAQDIEGLVTPDGVVHVVQSRPQV